MSKKEKIHKRLLKFWTKIACGIRYKYAATEETHRNVFSKRCMKECMD